MRRVGLTDAANSPDAQDVYRSLGLPVVRKQVEYQKPTNPMSSRHSPGTSQSDAARSWKL